GTSAVVAKSPAAPVTTAVTRAPTPPAEEARSGSDALPAASPDNRQLVSELAAARREIERLRSQLADRRTSEGDAAAQSALTEPQATLSATSAELAAARAGAGVLRRDLANAQSQLAEARAAAGANSEQATTARDAMAALERERATHGETQSALTQAKAR